MRMSQFLADQRVDFETLVHPPAFSAQHLAKYLHVPGRQVAKAVLLADTKGYLLAVLPATHYIDTDILDAVLGGPVRLAQNRELSEMFRDCEQGVVPSFGSL